MDSSTDTDLPAETANLFANMADRQLFNILVSFFIFQNNEEIENCWFIGKREKAS